MAQLTAARSRAIFAAIFVMGVVLRLYAALTFPLEQDELYTLAESRDLFHTTLAPGIDSRPLYYLIQHPLLAVLPDSPWALRVLPTLFGILGLWITWRLGRKYLGDAGGLVVLLLAAISPWHLYASGMARYYSLIYLCAALVVLWLPEAYESDRPARYLAVLAVFIVGTLTHPSFVFAMAGAVLGLALLRADGAVGWRWPSRAAWSFLWVPYLVVVAVDLLLVRLFGRSGGMANLGSRGLAATLRLVPAMIDWMTVPVFIAAMIGGWLLIRERGRSRSLGVMAICAVACTFVLLAGASLRTGVYADYGVGVLPLLLLCAGAVAVYAAPRLDGATGLVVITLLIVGSSAPSIVSFLADGLRFDYRPAYAEVRARDPNAAVLGWPEVLRKYYGGSLRGAELRPDSVYLDQTLARERSLWAIASVKRYGIVEDTDGELASWLSRYCRLADSFSRPRFDYRLYRVDLYRCQAAGAPPD